MIKQGRIVQLGKYYAPDVGGVETLTQNLAIGFAEAGWQSDVVVFAKGLSGRTLANGVKVTRCRMAFALASQPFSIGWIVRASNALLRAEPVILHAPNILGALVSVVFRRAPLIVFWHADVVNKAWLGRIIAPLEQAMLERAALIWATSDEYAQHSLPLQPWLAKLRILVPGIADPAQTERTADLNPKLATFIGGRTLILAVGRLVSYKGFDQLVEAAAWLTDDYAVTVVGEGPQRSALQKLIHQLGLSNRVLLAGRLNQEQLHALFRVAKLFAMTSNERSEAFGIAQIEALAHGVPIVATDVPGSGVSSVSDRGAFGALVPVGDPQALAAAILRVTKSVDSDRHGLHARSRFEKQYTLSRMTSDACADVARVIADHLRS
jgi:glycosyltransferase involved in cell wall biosynthesis